jgi:hypothetical protein
MKILGDPCLYRGLFSISGRSMSGGRVTRPWLMYDPGSKCGDLA